VDNTCAKPLIPLEAKHRKETGIVLMEKAYQRARYKLPVAGDLAERYSPTR